MVVASFAVFLGAQVVGLIPAASLPVFGPAFVDLTTVDLTDVGRAIGQLWKVASIVLFALIGTNADLEQVSSVLSVGMAIIAVGVIARLAGVAGSLRVSAPHANSGERLFIGLGTTGKPRCRPAWRRWSSRRESRRRRTRWRSPCSRSS